MTNPNYRHLAIVMDRSGSMQSIMTDAEGGLAEMLANLGAEQIHTTVSLYQFDSDYESVYEMTNIKDVPAYRLAPRGSTALLDAVGRTITSTGETLAAMPEEGRPSVVIVVITTDGHENASKEFNIDQVRELITHQKDVYDWRFMFLAADQDAFLASDSYRVGWNLAYRLTTNSGASYTVAERAAAMGEEVAPALERLAEKARKVEGGHRSVIKLPAGAWGWLDEWSHRRHLPRPVRNWICHRFDVACGCYDDSDIEEEK